jgi:hypothetical protein
VRATHTLRVELNAPASRVPEDFARGGAESEADVWERQPEEDHTNNARELQVTFCDLKADVSAGDVVYIGGGRYEWGSWACLLPQNVARYSEVCELYHVSCHQHQCVSFHQLDALSPCH